MDSGGLITRCDKAITLYCFPHSYHIGKRKGRFVLNLAEELKRIEEEWNSKYISIYDLFVFLQKSNDGIKYSEIAKVLLVRLDGLNPDESYLAIMNDIGQYKWILNYGIPTFKKLSNDQPKLLDYQWFNLFFDVLKEIKQLKKPLNLLSFSLDEFNGETLNTYQIFVEKERIEKALSIKITSNVEPDDTVLTQDKPTEISDELKKAHAKIEELNARIAELESEKEQENIVNYETYSIYGHTTPRIQALFKTIEKFWVNADLSQSDTIANAKDIEEWTLENFNVGKSIASAIQVITRPDEARFIGRKPK